MSITLASVLDTPAAGPLRLAVAEVLGRAEPLGFAGAGVERVGLACLQVLAAGHAAATDAGLGFSIADASPALVEMATLAGLDLLVTA